MYGEFRVPLYYNNNITTEYVKIIDLGEITLYRIFTLYAVIGTKQKYFIF